MTVQRLGKYQTADPFTRVPNAAINDERLDLKSRGLLLLMLSKPDDWRFTETNLARDAGVGVDQLRTAIARLIDAGYVHRYRELADGRPVLRTSVTDRALSSEEWDQALDAGRVPAPRRGDVPEVETPQPGETQGGTNEVDAPTNETPPTTESSAEIPTTQVAAKGWDEARELSEYLADAIVESGGPDANRPKVTASWVEHMEKLVRIDGRTPDQVRAAVDWVHRSPPDTQGAWWADKVLSPSNLRRHYEKLRRQARRETNGGRGRARGTSDEAYSEAFRRLAEREGVR